MARTQEVKKIVSIYFFLCLNFLFRAFKFSCGPTVVVFVRLFGIVKGWSAVL